MSNFRLLLLLSGLLLSVVALPNRATSNEKDKCGYSNCPKTDPNKLNVHIVPHSHDDVGWLKTVDQYFYGSKNYIQKAGVQYILDSVVQALLLNPERRFIYVETAFFWKWWQEKNDEVREQVRHLVNNGQLEIIGGGWSMNDEAAVHYQSTIDQFTWGFRKLNDTLGKCARPKIGWQIDPFGHSREMASLFTQFGFDGLFFARLDWRDKSNRLLTKTAEMLWQGSQNLGPSTQLFTSVLFNHYSAPPGFCFDVLCTDAPIIDNKNSSEYNAEEKAKNFLTFVHNQANFYKTNNIIITMGDDFNYQDALLYFTNLDKLIKAVNSLDSNATLFYSSPSCYLKALHEANLKWPLKTDDFFPYASDPHSYWNGYFTSRPTSKRFERFANNYLQVSKQIAALTLVHKIEYNLDPLREAIGIMQHHDAITGTEKQHVADDYARILTEALKSVDIVNENSFSYLQSQTRDLKFQTCFQLNISQCEFTENKDTIFVTVYNPISHPVSHYVRVPITEGNYKISYDGVVVESQHVPIFDKIANIPGRNSVATHEIIFKAELIPPLGFKRFEMKRLSFSPPTITGKPTENSYKLSFDKTGNLKSISMNNSEIKISQNFLYYPAAAGNNAVFKNRSSGAYIFRPQFTQARLVTNKVEMRTFAGPLVTEYHQKFNDWVGQVIRVYSDEKFVEFNWVVGPIPVGDDVGKEVISRFTTDLKTRGIFYTDANGREMIKRQRGHRETFNLTHEELIAENYYPVTSKIVIEDGIQRMSVLNDRAQGGSSIHDGEVELMVHRRLLRDDAFGVGEALNENSYGTGLVATGKHYLIAGTNNEESKIVAIEKDLASRILMEPWILFSPDDRSKLGTIREQMSGLKTHLPVNVQILTLEPWGEDTLLLRLEHIFEKDEDPKLSSPVTIDLKELFSEFKVVDIKEMSLGANQLLSEVNRLKWQSEGSDDEEINSIKKETNYDNRIVTIAPMEIKTYILTIN